MTQVASESSASIVGLKIKNFLSIVDLEIKPGQINQIVGKNNQGKTTVIKAMEFAAKGSSDASLVRHGQDAAEVVIELSDETTIRRRISAEGKSTVSVKRNGFLAPSPQSYLDGLFGSSAFNPLELLDPKKRTAAILNSIPLKITAERLSKEIQVPVDKLPPLDYDQHGLAVLDTCHKYLYQRRAEANKDVADKKKRWETYEADLPKTVFEKPPTREEITDAVTALNQTATELEAEIHLIDMENKTAELANTKSDRYDVAIEALKTEAQEVDRALAKHLDELQGLKEKAEHEAEKALAVLKSRIEDGERLLKEAQAEVPKDIKDKAPLLEQLATIRTDIEMTKGRVKDLEAFEAMEKQRAMVKDMENEFIAAGKTSTAITQRVEALAGPIKAKLMAEAEMPVAGLEYVDGGFLVNGIPVDNLSSSLALKLAIGVARKLAKKTKLICIDGAEQLDENTYWALKTEIEGDGYTYFVTKVGDAFPGNDHVIRMEKGAAVQ